VCAAVAGALSRAVAKAGLSHAVPVHTGGTYVCIEGPQFSTRAESLWYRSLGAHVIGMTNLPEAKLAREAQIAYATLAMVTDYDCWHPREAAVTADLALANLMKNAEHAQRIAAAAIRILGAERPASIAHSALTSGLVTQPQNMAPEVRERLAAILPGSS
jgi:5'-methylthioadenosine phosphorylase